MTIKLNTTDYAILGLLARKPWSAYELTQYMRISSIRAIWPRAESRLYESPKKLVKLGLASSVNESNGKKPRTVYTISEEGRIELDIWLHVAGKTLIIEYEAMLKLLFGDIDKSNQQQQMLSTIERQVNDSCQELENAFSGLQVLESIEVSPARYAQNLLINSYIKEMTLAQKKWLAFAKDFQQQWDNNSNEEEALALVMEQYRIMLDDIQSAE
jgi:PadR family transcriptional regulator AphA